MNKDNDSYNNLDRSELAEALRDEGMGSKARRFETCKEESVVIGCNECGNIEMYDKNCQLRICSKCDVKKHRIRSRYGNIVKNIDSPVQIEVTVENVEDISRDDISQIRDDFHEMRDSVSSLSASEIRDHEGFDEVSDGRRDKALRIMDKVGYDMSISGGMYAIELKNQGNGWNLHLHAVLDVEFIPQAILSKEWEKASGNSVVYIQDVDNCSESLNYLTKYLTKPPELENVDQAVKYLRVTNNLRLMGTFGDLYDISPEDIEGECPECGSTDLFWFGSTGMFSEDGRYSTPDVSHAPPDQSRLFTTESHA